MNPTSESLPEIQARLAHNRATPIQKPRSPQLASAPVTEPERPKPQQNAPKTVLRLVIDGQVRGGKNAMGVGQSGKHYAQPLFRNWRNRTRDSIITQIPAKLRSVAWMRKTGAIFTGEVTVNLEYWSGDKRRRDQSAIIDALWHVLEGAGVVKDDAQLWVTESTRGYDKDNPRAVLRLEGQPSEPSQPNTVTG